MEANKASAEGRKALRITFSVKEGSRGGFLQENTSKAADRVHKQFLNFTIFKFEPKITGCGMVKNIHL